MRTCEGVGGGLHGRGVGEGLRKRGEKGGCGVCPATPREMKVARRERCRRWRGGETSRGGGRGGEEVNRKPAVRGGVVEGETGTFDPSMTGPTSSVSISYSVL